MTGLRAVEPPVVKIQIINNGQKRKDGISLVSWGLQAGVLALEKKKKKKKPKFIVFMTGTVVLLRTLSYLIGLFQSDTG